MFDSQKQGKIEKEKVRTILNTLGHTFDDHELETLLKQEEDEDGTKIFIFFRSFNKLERLHFLIFDFNFQCKIYNLQFLIKIQMWNWIY